jgi:predicted DNA-binding WGR domain protein
MKKIWDVVYLENTEQGHNKFYLMEKTSLIYWEASYGKIGTPGVTMKYPMSVWHKKKNEKLKKGYVDKTNSWKHISNTTNQSDEKVIINNTHLEKVNLILLFIKNFPTEFGQRSLQFLRDVNAVKESLLKSGELSKDEMKYLNEIWIKLSEKLGDLNTLRSTLSKL